MNITSYVRFFGNKQFKDFPFNEVDALIFSELAYINFDLSIKEMNFVKLKDLKIEDEKTFYEGSVDALHNKRLINAMRKSKRYKDVKIGFCRSFIDKQNFTQFFAMTLVMPDNSGFIAFRGTDTSILGWKEDLYLVYEGKMPGQERAANYLREAAHLFAGQFYVGGHSKGGNLAFYAALHMGKKLESRFIKAYSFDGPGFKDGISHFEAYDRIGSRLEKYLTTKDIIGVVYNEVLNPKIVYSSGVLLGGHDPFTWSVSMMSGTFVYAKDRSMRSKKTEDALMSWLIEESYESKRLAVDILMTLFGQANTIYDLLLQAARVIANRKTIFSGYTVRQKEEAKETFKKLGRYYLSTYSPKKYLMKSAKAEKAQLTTEKK